MIQDKLKKLGNVERLGKTDSLGNTDRVKKIYAKEDVEGEEAEGEMKIQIKNRYTEEVIYETEAKTIKEAVEKAVEEKADLSEADLSEADLSEADLNAIYYKTKITKKQKEEIIESDLFEEVEDG